MKFSVNCLIDNSHKEYKFEYWRFVPLTDGMASVSNLGRMRINFVYHSRQKKPDPFNVVNDVIRSKTGISIEFIIDDLYYMAFPEHMPDGYEFPPGTEKEMNKEKEKEK